MVDGYHSTELDLLYIMLSTFLFDALLYWFLEFTETGE